MQHPDRILHRRVTNTLGQRAPALINLPIPIPSIPILSPILEPIIGGPSSAPQSSPTPPPSSGGTQGGGGSSNNGGGGSPPASGGSGGSSGGSSGGGSQSGGGTNNGGSSSGGGSSSSSSGTGSGAPSSGGSSPSSPSSGSGGTGGSSGGSGSSGNTSVGSASSGGSSTDSNTGGAGAAGGSSNSTGSSVTTTTDTNGSSVVNAAESNPSSSGDGAVGSTNVNGGDSSGNVSGGYSQSGKQGGQSGSNSPGGTTAVYGGLPGSETNSVNGGGSGDNGSNNNGPSKPTAHGAVSGGVIAAICIVVGLVLLILFFIGLRRWRRQRMARRHSTWIEQGRRGAFAFLGGGHSEKERNSKDGNGFDEKSGLRSARSSFGTNIDHQFPQFPPLPDGSDASLFYHSTTTIVPDMPTQAEPAHTTERHSTFSVGSEGSPRDSSASQYLLMPPIAPDLQGVGIPQAQLSPISVRPFSPTESWAFPQPPTTTSPQMTTAGLRSSTEASAEFTEDQLPVAYYQEVSDSGHDNPFEDFTEITGAESSGERPPLEVGCIEPIRRPFEPTLHDELGVYRGDKIRLLAMFDDGWVQVEKIEDGEVGLIPIDCLREAGEELPSFLASRRVSSAYGGVTAQAL